MFTKQHEWSLDLLDGTPEIPQEQLHNSRMTLISPKECEIVRCNPNQFEMTPDSAVLDLVQSPIPHPTRQVACLTLGNYRDSLIYPSQNKRNTSLSRGTRKSSMDAISSREESGFSPRDEARFPCIVSTAIVFSQSNT